MTQSTTNSPLEAFSLSLDDELFLYQIEQKLNEWSKGNAIYLHDINMFTQYLERFLVSLNVSKARISEIIPIRIIQRHNFTNALPYVQTIRTFNKTSCIEGCMKLLGLLEGTRNKIIEYQSK